MAWPLSRRTTINGRGAGAADELEACRGQCGRAHTWLLGRRLEPGHGRGAHNSSGTKLTVRLLHKLGDRLLRDYVGGCTLIDPGHEFPRPGALLRWLLMSSKLPRWDIHRGARSTVLCKSQR